MSKQHAQHHSAETVRALLKKSHCKV